MKAINKPEKVGSRKGGQTDTVVLRVLCQDTSDTVNLILFLFPTNTEKYPEEAIAYIITCCRNYIIYMSPSSDVRIFEEVE